MKTARCFPIAVVMLVPLILVSGDLTPTAVSAGPASVPVLTAVQQKKIASGRLLQHLSQKYSQARTLGKAVSEAFITVAVYASEPPSQRFAAELEQRGVHPFADSWIPPSQHHPLGFFLAQVPAGNIADVLALDYVKKMDTAESESVPQNNRAARGINADVAWSQGWTGTGITVGVLDSGLDLGFSGTDLPATIAVKDYSNYPTLDTIVTNMVLGHGTHVTGSILGRGSLSASNTANGGAAYKGMAPNASLVFLKIGNDYNAAASDAAEISAIRAAADDYHVTLLNLSYGGWETYHDGSNPVAQAIDYAYSKGTACFVAAGNFGSQARHVSGSVPAQGISDFIPVTVTNPGAHTQLQFNLVWSDGTDRNNLSLQYYDGAKNPLTEVTRWATTESPRGTESQYSKYDPYVSNQPGTFYLRVENPSLSAQDFQIYEDLGEGGRVTFAAADPNYTIAYPGDADHAFTVSAYNSRVEWMGADGSPHNFGNTLQTCASFSSRGPRVDNVVKPNITAPGSKLISLRDRDVLIPTTMFCVDNDGAPGGDANYYVMEGTSMAAPVCAGAAAILFQHSPGASPQQIYDAIMLAADVDAYTGPIPNPTWGYGKLDVSSALLDLPLPVEITSFTSSVRGESISLAWRTAAEVNNYGFDIEKKEVRTSFANAAQSRSGAWTTIGFVAGSGTSNIQHEYRFVDTLLRTGTYAYRLKQIDRDGKCTYSTVLEASASAGPVAYSLSQNYPNPFNPTTTVQYTIPAVGRVRIAVFDLLGREVAVLADRQMEPGYYSVEWTAAAIPSGVYFYRLDAGPYHETRKLIVQK